MNTIDRVAALRPMVERNGFAASLVRQFDANGKLSTKQWYWVEKLSSEAAAPRSEETIKVADNFDGVHALIERARLHLKYPKIRLHFNGHPLVVKVAGERSRYNGDILLTDGRPFGENRFYGRVRKGGEFIAGRDARDELVRKPLADLLGRLGREPAKVASEHGKLLGNCCFCNRPLEDERSTAVGYGKICAGHYGLPWGA